MDKFTFDEAAELSANMRRASEIMDTIGDSAELRPLLHAIQDRLNIWRPERMDADKYNGE